MSDAAESAVGDIIHNLCNTFGRILYSLKIEHEKKGSKGQCVADLDTLIRAIVTTSHRTDHEDSYPVWDEKEHRVLIARLCQTLEEHGIFSVDRLKEYGEWLKRQKGTNGDGI